MKRYFIGTLAVLATITVFAFTMPSKTKSNNFADFYWQFNSGSATALSSYTQLADIPGGATAQQQYNALCSSGNVICAMRTNTASPTLSDTNSDNIPDLTGGVVEAKKKH